MFNLPCAKEKSDTLILVSLFSSCHHHPQALRLVISIR